MRPLYWLTGLLLAGQMACGGGCGGCDDSSGYVYPRAEPRAAPTQKSIRGRITQQGFDTIMAGVPDILYGTCCNEDSMGMCELPPGTGSCAINPVDADEAWFFLETDFTVGEVRAGSHIGMDLDSMRGNLHAGLIQDGSGGAIQITIGCDEPNFLDCNDMAEWVEASVDLDVRMNEVPFIYDEAACFVQDKNPPTPGMLIQSIQFTIKPRIDLGMDQKPYLMLRDEDITIDRFEAQFDMDMGAQVSDPLCMGGDNCAYCGAGNTILSIIEALLSTGIVAELLVNQLANLMLDSLAQDPLEASGGLDIATLLPVANPGANVTGFLVSANTDSPTVTGVTNELGWNIDFDTGFVADRHPCTPAVAPLSFVLPAPPDPDLYVDSPQGLEPHHLSAFIGDSAVNRLTHNLYDSGSLCFTLDAESLSALTDQFSPSVGGLSLLAPGLAHLAPNDAPVNIGISPTLPPLILWGSGETVMMERDSHIKLLWPGVAIELIPLVDDAFVRAIAFSTDIEVGLSLDPDAQGNIMLSIDQLELANASEFYNEMTTPFDAAGVGSLLGVFLDTFLSDASFDVALSAEQLGMPFVPKLRKVDRTDDERYLMMFLRFCTAAEIADMNNTLCWEDPSMSGMAVSQYSVGVERVAVDEAPGTVRVRAISNVAPSDRVQLAYRPRGTQMWWSFRDAGPDGLYTFEHPGFSWPGVMYVEVVARDRDRPTRWTRPEVMVVRIDNVPPNIRARRTDRGVEIDAWDDATPTARVRIAGSVDGPAGLGTLALEPRDFVPASPYDTVTLWAVDDADLRSEVVVLVGDPVPAGDPIVTSETGGCAAAPGSLAALAGLILLRPRPRRRPRRRRR